MGMRPYEHILRHGFGGFGSAHQADCHGEDHILVCTNEVRESLMSRNRVDLDAWRDECARGPRGRVRQGCHVGQQ